MRGRDQAAQIAIAILDFRDARSSALPSFLFSEIGWELLLSLFVADAAGIQITGRMVSNERKLTPSVTSRWLIVLNKSGLVVGDGTGNLDDLLTLSGTALDALEQLLRQADEFRMIAN